MSWLKELKKKLPLNFKGDYRFHEPLSNHTTFRIGGKCSLWCQPRDLGDLNFILRYRKIKKIPLFIMGEGSNILVRDSRFKGIVIHLDSPYFKRMEFKGNSVLVGSGARLKEIIQLAIEKNLGGLEFLTGIPGSLGGAVMMNAGISEVTSNQQPVTRNIGDLVESVRVIDYNGKIKNLNKKDIKFGYRTSNLLKYIILNAHLKLAKKNRQEIKNKIDEYKKFRRRKQNLKIASAGCIFKNPEGDSAGRIIEVCGLKGKRIGQAQVSSKHGNFILNKGNAKARDVLRLIEIIQKKVYKRYRILLKPEIKII